MMPFEAQPQMKSLGPFAWHASVILSNGTTAHLFLRESWSKWLFALPLTEGKWLEKVTFSFFKDVLQQLQGNLNSPWMYLEGEDFFHAHLWMLSCGNDLSKSRTFSSSFYSSEAETWVFSYFFFLFFSFFFFYFFPFLFPLTLEVYGYSPLLFSYEVLLHLQQHSFWAPSLCSVSRALLLWLFPLTPVTSLTCCTHTHFSTTFPAMLFVPSDWVSDGGTVNIQVRSSLPFLCGFKCRQALRLPRLFTERSFLGCDIFS